MDRVNLSRIEKDALRQGRLPRIDMRTNSDIPDLLDVTEHRLYL